MEKVSTLAIGKKYADFRDYFYPILRQLDNTHKDMRREVISDLVGGVKLIYEAAHSNQISRVRILDARLATLREHIRHLQKLKIQKWDKERGVNYHKTALRNNQAEHAELLLSQVGGIVYAWRKKLGDYKGYKDNDKNKVDDAPLNVTI